MAFEEEPDKRQGIDEACLKSSESFYLSIAFANVLIRLKFTRSRRKTQIRSTKFDDGVRIYLNASNEKTYRFWLNPMKNARKTPGT